jgi:thiosulfate/3-mercaptopyruvate sulfurtransferase
VTAVKTTVTPRWLRHHLSSKRIVVLDARSRSAYSKLHISGSRLADLFHYFVPGTDRKNLALFHQDLQSKLRRLGVNGHETPIIYETGFGMRAARVAWMLEYSGVKSPMMLEGGFQAWEAEGYPVEKRRRTVVPSEFEIHPNSKVLATADFVNVLSRSRTSHVLDVRSSGEYEGSEKRDCCSRSGRVPGASWIEWTRFLGKKGKFLDQQSIRDQLRSVGIVRDSPVAIYCHRGARAASAFYALRSIGYTNARNYVGSWHEWSSKRSLPTERG